MREFDVIVLGNGISGCVSAALLANNGLRVLMVSRDEGTTYHLPESWIFSISPSIKKLGIEKKITSAFKKQTSCVFSSSDNQHSVKLLINNTSETKNGDLVFVDRNQLGRVLLNAALEQGAVFQPLSHIASCQISDTEILLDIETTNKHYDFRASCIIDATGKSAFLSQHLKLPLNEKKLDSRVAYFSHFEIQTDMPEEMRIVHIQGGYLFCLPISNQRLSIGCVIADGLVDINIPPEQIFALATSSSSYIANLIARSKKILPIIPVKNYQCICLEPAGPSYRLVGDAAAFLDPFFCPGIDFAFFSAEHAATLMQSSHQDYKAAVEKWLENQQYSAYEKIERSDWNGMLRLFADPHLPHVVPLILTQAFCQLQGEYLPFENGVRQARRAYEMASC